MPQYNYQTQCKYQFKGKKNHKPHQHHADSDSPNYLEYNNIKQWIKSPTQGNDENFDQYQPETSFYKKKTQFFSCSFQAHEITGGTGKEYKNGSTIMRDPTGKEQAGKCGLHIGWIHCNVCTCFNNGFKKEIADMVKRHDDYYNSTKYINSLDPEAGCIRLVHGFRFFWRTPNYESMRKEKAGVINPISNTSGLYFRDSFSHIKTPYFYSKYAFMRFLKLTALPIFILSALLFTSCEQDDDPEIEIFSGTGLPMTGAQETPPVATAATGSIDASYSTATQTLTYKVTWSGLSGPVAAAHIHGTAETGYLAGVLQGFSGFPNPALYGTSGSYSGSLFADGVKIREEDIIGGRYYINLHTAANPGGEIRGQLILTRQ